MSGNSEQATAISRRHFLVGGTAAGISAIVSACTGDSGHETAVASYPAAIKLMVVHRKRPDFDDEQFYDYWMNQHGPYAVQQFGVLGAFRYIQSHTDDSTLNTEMRATRGQVGTAEQGMSSVWFPSAQALLDKLKTPEGIVALGKLAADEANFTDLSACSHFYVIEWPVIDG